MNVKTRIANNGIISAHNLQTAGSSEEDNGSIEAMITQPRKKPADFITVIPIFFKMNPSRSSDCLVLSQQHLLYAFKTRNAIALADHCPLKNLGNLDMTLSGFV